MFKWKKSEKIDGIGIANVYSHSSGCRLVYIENEDINRVFIIGFNTLPSNDKGIPHIVEHSVLCGSEGFRVKDPFNILDKGSIHTYLNAMTYRDKTVYPVGSTNEKDFKTLMRVYCDAVFKPLMYKNEGIFRQEGWNSDGKEFNGIVLNEMKGVYSDPAVVLSEKINKEMFGGSCYGNDSGGDPDCITDLTYEEFLDFHNMHYHPSNAVIFLYGKIDINEYLDILDSEFLGEFEYRKSVFEKPPVPKESGSLEISCNTNGSNILSAAFYTGGTDDNVRSTMLGILSTMWCYTEGGNIKEALLNAGLGDKVSCDFDDSGLASIMEITIENSDETNTDKFREVLNNTFKEMAENGVDEYKLKGVINSIKFFFKEEDFGYKPRGLFYGLLILNSFLKGRESFDSVKINYIFDHLKDIDIKDIVKEYFIDKGIYGILKADNSIETKNKTVPPANNEALLKYQSMEDSPEEIKKLMAVKVSDISKEGFKINYEEDNGNIFTPIEGGDIVYIDIYFDVSEFENTLALSGYKAVADIYDKALSNDIDYYAGGFSIEITALQRENEFKPVIKFKIKCLKENTEKCLELFERVVFQTYNNRDRISRLASEARQGLKNAYTESGNVKAIGEALGMVSGAMCWINKAKGFGYYDYLGNEPEEIMSDINSVSCIFKRGNAFYAIGCVNEDREKISALVEKTLDKLPKGGGQNLITMKTSDTPRGFIINGNVNFNAAAFSMDGSDGIARVAQQIISREYLWDKVRLEGGAYGGSCVLGRHYGYMYSYRDPGLEKTYAVFEEAGRYLAESKYTQEDIDRFIIGTINEIDRPVKKHSLTDIAVRKFFSLEDEGISVKRRSRILSAKPEDIKEFGEYLSSLELRGICTVGRENALKECQKFKELYRID